MTTVSKPSSPTLDSTVSADVHVSTAGLSDTQYSQGRRRMLELVHRLRATGVQLDLDLPGIAVIGSQSAGKSSLIESISGITLPRASGTCTRCPTECRLRNSQNDWVCTVSLRFASDARGEARDVPFGPEIKSKTKVEERIKRAQRAILNPSTDHSEFLDGAEDDRTSTELSFSKNCVCLDISGSEVEDLSFIDLPGLIVSVGSSNNKEDIHLVRGLVEHYIEKPSCLILLTVSCETDFENQGAFQLAKQHDPEGVRTIGVLTKPDRIDSGNENDWIKFITNDREPLSNGWFAVKQPDANALKSGISFEDARAQEKTFFTSARYWSAIDTDYQRQLGTGNLSICLSRILSDLISKRMPQLQEDLHKLLTETEEKLHDLPKLPSTDAVTEVYQLIRDFGARISRDVEGVAEEDSLIHRFNTHSNLFKQEIRATAPDFRPFDADDADSDEEYTVSTPEFLRTEEDITTMQTEDSGNAIYLGDVRKQIEDAITRELPGHYPFVVVKNQIRAITQKWASPAKKYALTIHSMLAAFVRNVVQEHFSKYSCGGFEQRVLVLVSEHISVCMNSADQKIDWLLKLETDPFTLNRHYYGDYKDKFLAHYKSIYNKAQTGNGNFNFHEYNAETADLDQRVAVDGIIAHLASLGVHGVTPGKIARMLPNDHTEDALTIMAEVRAYYQVAYKRVSDLIPLAVDFEILRGLTRGIESSLFKGLQLGGKDGEERCKDLLQEPSNIVSRRDDLMKRRERLYKAKQTLMTLPMN